jgi:hypothetical protein
MNPKQYLTGKLLELEGVSVKPGLGKGDKFVVNNVEFAYFIENGVRVLLSETGKERLGETLQADPRASFVEDGWVDLKFENDVEVELVFVFIRYSWKFAKS